MSGLISGNLPHSAPGVAGLAAADGPFAKRLLFVAGDSNAVPAGVAAVTNWTTTVMAALTTWEHVNSAVSGNTVALSMTGFSNRARRMAFQGRPQRLVALQMGHGDLGAGTAAATIWTALQTACATVIAKGGTPILFTPFATTSVAAGAQETARQTLRNSIRSGYAAAGALLVDVCALHADLDDRTLVAASSLFAADDIHLSTSGNALVATAVQVTIAAAPLATTIRMGGEAGADVAVQPWAEIYHTGADGTRGGTATAGSWGELPITAASLNDPHGLIREISGNSLILKEGGEYEVEVQRAFCNTQGTQVRVYGVTGAASLGSGVGCFVGGGNSEYVSAKVTFTATAGFVFRGEYKVANTVADYGLGFECTLGETERFGVTRIRRIGPVNNE